MAQYIGRFTSDIRGKCGGLVFTRNKQGTAFRSLARPTGGNTPARRQQGARLHLATAYWRGFHANRILAWNTLAGQQPVTNNIGQTTARSGFQLFVSAQITASLLGTTAPFDPPHWPPVIPIATSITGNIASHICTISIVNSQGTLPSGYVSISKKLNGFTIGLARIGRLKYMAGASASATIVISAPYLAHFGLPLIAGAYYVRYTPCDPASYIPGPAITVETFISGI